MIPVPYADDMQMTLIYDHFLAINWLSDCGSTLKSLSSPFPDDELKPELTPELTVLAAEEPGGSEFPMLAKGSREFRISASAFWLYPEERVAVLPGAGGFMAPAPERRTTHPTPPIT
ncbi:jg14228 [Pararge aegeria aegeria]|uniref:Jg14228 protein n=1 Tax=Pararge aegeria aegeria TaxID=348720 RepID=A0A8S4RTY6_9NEOP|nr:jg14228 [Pararge aegeria aegeria]